MCRSSGWPWGTSIQNHCSPFSEPDLKTVEHVLLYACAVAQGTEPQTWFQHPVLQWYRLWSNTKLAGTNTLVKWCHKGRKEFCFIQRSERGRKNKQLPYSKLICLKFPIFELTNINVNLNAVGYHPRSIFRLLAMLLVVKTDIFRAI